MKDAFFLSVFRAHGTWYRVASTQQFCGNPAMAFAFCCSGPQIASFELLSPTPLFPSFSDSFLFIFVLFFPPLFFSFPLFVGEDSSKEQKRKEESTTANTKQGAGKKGGKSDSQHHCCLYKEMIYHGIAWVNQPQRLKTFPCTGGNMHSWGKGHRKGTRRFLVESEWGMLPLR